ncbi:uncharacterized protein LOC129307946 [Prosopis cineraria]|uniref:uncharacterized protein LOC129307946 n=1 Tax=Prosopis cineraria TaxID=364024 RepID=UPI00240EEE87|nr:uncharacterized protein LOC129307946 [Prosopis cineraria]
MASLVNKRLLIVVFFILCFISLQARARSLKEKETINSTGHEQQEGHDHHQTVLKPKANNNNEANNAEGEVFSMDYTPASRKPPIHN